MLLIIFIGLIAKLALVCGDYYVIWNFATEQCDWTKVGKNVLICYL
jgi:hypothetical protein